MWKAYFGDFSTGRLKRLQYLGYAILLAVLMTAFMLAIVFAIGAGEHLIGGDLQQAQDKLRGWFGVPASIIVMVIFMAAALAKLNIMAKRIRDMGLSGWWLAIAILLAIGATSTLHTEQTGGVVFCFVSLALLLVPSNTFGKKT